MIVRYGNYSHADAEVHLQTNKESLVSDQKLVYGYTVTITLFGRLHGANAAEITTKFTTLTNAYALQRRDLTLFDNDGNPTAIVLNNATSLHGVRVTRPPHPPDLKDAQYTSFVDYVIELQAEYGYNLGEPAVVQYSESLQIIGDGGPQFVVKAGLYGPQRQTTRLATPVRAIQSGSASIIGDDWPRPNPPVFPTHEHRDRKDITRVSPKPNDRGLPEYTTTWKYEFTAPGALAGFPTVL